MKFVIYFEEVPKGLPLFIFIYLTLLRTLPFWVVATLTQQSPWSLRCKTKSQSELAWLALLVSVYILFMWFLSSSETRKLDGKVSYTNHPRIFSWWYIITFFVYWKIKWRTASHLLSSFRIYLNNSTLPKITRYLGPRTGILWTGPNTQFWSPNKDWF